MIDTVDGRRLAATYWVSCHRGMQGGPTIVYQPSSVFHAQPWGGAIRSDHVNPQHVETISANRGQHTVTKRASSPNRITSQSFCSFGTPLEQVAGYSGSNATNVEWEVRLEMAACTAGTHPSKQFKQTTFLHNCVLEILVGQVGHQRHPGLLQLLTWPTQKPGHCKLAISLPNR